MVPPGYALSSLATKGVDIVRTAGPTGECSSASCAGTVSPHPAPKCRPAAVFAVGAAAERARGAGLIEQA
jgi:hypothetical protein